MVEVVDFDWCASEIEGLAVLTMKQVSDERGVVREFFRASAFGSAGPGDLGPWQQINVTDTVRGGVRGIHAESMNKLVAVVTGAALGAYVDLRPDSSSFGAVVTIPLVPGVQVLVPRGVGNGFQATADGTTQYLYCFDEEWQPGMAGWACSPLDPALGIEWPVAIDVDDRAQISEKDLQAPTLAELQARIEDAHP